jgi:hypothetical protein
MMLCLSAAQAVSDGALFARQIATFYKVLGPVLHSLPTSHGLTDLRHGQRDHAQANDHFRDLGALVAIDRGRTDYRRRGLGP